MTAAMWRCPKCGLTSTKEFTWAHKAAPGSKSAGKRTCGGNPVKVQPGALHE